MLNKQPYMHPRQTVGLPHGRRVTNSIGLGRLSLLSACVLTLTSCSASEGPGDVAGRETVTVSPTTGGNPGGGGQQGGTGVEPTDTNTVITVRPPPESCGDARLQTNEACDDGNMADGDGCAANCLIEDNWLCDASGLTCTRFEVCGDGRVKAGAESCDDGNITPGDGCSEACQTESGYACPTPGTLCTNIQVCGDKTLTGVEACDDGNTTAGDGCSATCTLELGFVCSVAGIRCTPVCGDGLVMGREDCDDGNVVSADGCSSTCASEVGWFCSAANPSVCQQSVCGDGVANGGEGCDDGNDNDLGDGCSPGCKAEPTCTPGAGCTSSCGDGLILPGDVEECDDGNLKDGDGCSATCIKEAGFECVTTTSDGANRLSLPIVYRDFIGKGWEDSPDQSFYEPAGFHEDFENKDYSYAGTLTDWPEEGEQLNEPNEYSSTGYEGIVADALGPDAKPLYAGPATPNGDEPVSGQANFNQWFNDVDGVNFPIVDELVLDEDDGAYVFEDDEFFPLDEAGFVTAEGGNKEKLRPKDWLNRGCWDALTATHLCDTDEGDCELEGAERCDAYNTHEDCVDKHNYSFTSEVRYWFEYQGGEQLVFQGDDDVWVFINGQLLVDLGGLHEPRGADVCGNTWPLVCVGGREDQDAVCDELDLDFDEAGEMEPPNCAGLSATTTDVSGKALGLVEGKVYEVAVFQAERHTCQSNYKLTLTGFRQTSTTCTPVCGDGVTTADEQCDDGPLTTDPATGAASGNGAGYNFCNANCTLGPRCGDMVQQPEEECDDGINIKGHATDANPGTCAPGCKLPKRCGDGVFDSAFGEQCDLGDAANTGAYDGCNLDCTLGPRCGDNVVQADANEQCDDGNRRNGDRCNVACQNERVINN